MARILVTGANGFIGRGLCPVLTMRGHAVIAGVRRIPPNDPAAADTGSQPLRRAVLGDLTPSTDWSAIVSGVDIVIHLAQRAHQPADSRLLDAEPEIAAGLARAAARAGVRRLVYASSIKAMGDTTPPGRPFRASDIPRPDDAYGRTKLATEHALSTAALETGLELVVLRPPLVYGPGVGANFAALVRLAGSGLPLPFGGIDNRRSLICRDNLVDLIAIAAVHPAAAGQILLAADGTDFSTPDLIRVLAAGQGRTARLFRMPGMSLKTWRRTPRIGSRLARLKLFLQVDDQATRALLNWHPPVAAETGLRAAAGSRASA
ncbi:MAG TPA: NAD-dependent epimerase/dehydratase family protein [Stellaceae bacterium]|jgi:nucleoside-diphosphate-sugar epimerase|nr:NAD-dependent epimerase/dehydratase family protein [Stellaceae bacterium]